MSSLVVPGQTRETLTKEHIMAKTKDRKLKKVHVPAHTKKVKGKTVKVREHYRSTPD